MSETRIILVSGLSGSGKSTATAALEDLGFYCVDNLPPPLIERFLDLAVKATPPIRKVGLALDAREASFLRDLSRVIERLRARGEVELVFLDCSDAVLEQRYRETRRVHPFAPGGRVSEGIAAEREVLADVAKLADSVIDTSGMNVHQLRDAIVRHVAHAVRRTVVNLMSFGFRYGTPDSVELLFDVRFLPNPHFEPALSAKSGHDAEVADYVLKHEHSAQLLERLRDLIDFLLPLYDAEGKAYLTVGVGCTGGRHRSVAIANALAEGLRARGRDVNVEHRDVEKRR